MDNLRVLIELFPWSLAVGVLTAALCAGLGVYVILKRIVFIGAALSEAAALGIAAGMVFVAKMKRSCAATRVKLK